MNGPAGRTQSLNARWLAAVLAVPLLLTAVPALAGGSKEEAKKFDAMAREAYKHKRWDDAIAWFQAAWEAHPQPKYLYNMGRICEKKGDLPRAIEYLEHFLKDVEDEKDRDDAQAMLKMVRIKLKQKKGEVRVASTPPRAIIRLKSARDLVEAVTPWSGWLDYGPYELTVELADHETHKQTVVVERNRPVKLELALKAVGVKPPPPVAKPTEKPAAKPTEKPAAKPVQKPAAKPVAKPAEKPAAKPAKKKPAKKKPAKKKPKKKVAKAPKPVEPPPDEAGGSAMPLVLGGGAAALGALSAFSVWQALAWDTEVGAASDAYLAATTRDEIDKEQKRFEDAKGALAGWVAAGVATGLLALAATGAALWYPEEGGEEDPAGAGAGVGMLPGGLGVTVWGRLP